MRRKSNSARGSESQEWSSTMLLFQGWQLFCKVETSKPYWQTAAYIFLWTSHLGYMLVTNAVQTLFWCKTLVKCVFIPDQVKESKTGKSENSLKKAENLIYVENKNKFKINGILWKKDPKGISICLISVKVSSWRSTEKKMQLKLKSQDFVNHSPSCHLT